MKFILNILNGRYLVAEGAGKNWVMLFLLALLAIFMIASSHRLERKVHKISEVNKEVQELRTVFVEQRKALMRLKMESTILEKVKDKGIVRSKTPAYKLIEQP